MATTVSVKNVTRLQNAWLVAGSIALSGNYVANGDALDLTSSKIPVSATTIPTFVSFSEMPAVGTPATGYEYAYAVGADGKSGKLQIFSAPATQFAAGAYSAPLLASKINFQAIIPAL